MADLQKLSCKNVGKGEIKFKVVCKDSVQDEFKTRNYEFSDCSNLIIKGRITQFEILPSENDRLSIDLIGNDNFLTNINIHKKRNGIVMQNKHRNRRRYVNRRGSEEETFTGKVIIKSPKGISLFVNTNCSGIGVVEIPLNLLRARIDGSMKLNCQIVNTLGVKINGSGSVKVSNINESCSIVINGSGSVVIGNGEISEIKTILNGSGNVSASVIANRAELTLRGSGDIFIKQVLEETIEVHRGSGKVNVGLRGR